jgi:hypothetical protein
MSTLREEAMTESALLYHELHTVDDIVAAVNKDGTSEHTGIEIAAQYAIKCASDGDYGCGDGELAGHLEYLADYGAKFDHEEALKVACAVREALGLNQQSQQSQQSN